MENAMGRRRKPENEGLPANLYVDTQKPGWYVKSPKTGERRHFTDLAVAKAFNAALAGALAEEREAEFILAGRPTVGGLVDKWIRDQLGFMGWRASTRTNNLAKIKRIKRELGHRALVTTDSPFLTDWLAAFCHTPDTFNKWRYALVILFDFAVSRKMIAINEAANVQERSMSLNLEANQKVRHELDIDGFKAIHTFAPPWLQLAMDTALVTLQGRNEIVNILHTDFRDDGFLYVIREKVSNKSDAAFIRIKVTEDIRALRSRALRLDDIASPYFIHYRPAKLTDAQRAAKPHWTCIMPDYLTKAFAEARTEARVYTHLRDEEQPTFHEIRGLGGRLCKDRGMEAAAIKILMAHADQKTTDIYLKSGKKGLRDSDFVVVEAPLTLAQLLG
jgi:hypothetical protein